jgi:hypothetical protein
MAQFNIMGELRLKIRVTLFKRLFVKEHDERVEIFIIGPLNPASIVQTGCSSCQRCIEEYGEIVYSSGQMSSCSYLVSFGSGVLKT